MPAQIDGQTELIAHLGYPTHSFKAPMIYNPYFAAVGVNAVVVPMGCKPESFAQVLRGLFALENMRGALITMPHKVSVVEMLDEASPAVKVAGACNAVRRLPDGRLAGEQFDGEGFVRGLKRKGLELAGARALVVGSGGVGCAIAASLAGAAVAEIALYDVNPGAAEGAGRPAGHALSGGGRALWRQRSGGLRPGGQRHAAGHESRRPAAGGRFAAATRAPGSARW